jgi:GNAT superfamily N-acetyltransferase
MHPLVIRTAEVGDAAAIAALHVEGWEEFRPFVPAAVMAARRLQHRTDEWRRRLQDADPRWWIAVAEDAEGVVGFVGVEHLAAASFGANSEIHQLSVAEACRRHGLGRRPLAAADLIARTRNRLPA